LTRAAGTGLVLAAGGLLALGRSILSADEAWFLQVVRRVASGEVLYRDVFFGVPPLSVYLLAPLAWAWRPEVWLVRAALVACVAATALLCSLIARRLGSDREFSSLLGAALLLLAFPVPMAPYAPLATLFLLAALAAVVRWEEAVGRSRRALVLAGVACGMAFASKQNIGLYALGAVLLLVLSSRPRPGETGRRRPLSLVSASFLLSAAATLVPVWWSGALPEFLDYGFLNKGTYPRRAGVSYFEGLRSLAGLLRSDPFSPALVANAAYLLPPLAWAGLAWSWRRSSGAGRRQAAIVAAFCAAATLGLFPRADEVHVAYMMPVFLLAVAFAWQSLGLGRTRGGRLAHRAASLVLPALLTLRISRPLLGLAAGTASVSSLPHFTGVVMPTDTLASLRVQARRLQAAAGEGAFLLSSKAAFYYLAGGLRNPTPFDYPLVTAFGRHGEARVVGDIRAGRISSVCVDPQMLRNPLRPPLLEALVEREMILVGDEGFCRMYRLAAAGRED
jgi:4-amino-4-deoxy-L-arabinose transferase-like glycosyltransferase